MRERIVCVGAALMMLWCSGCGYRVGAVNLDDPIKTVYIPGVKNNTTEPAIQARATSKIVTAFQVDGTYTVVNEKDADAILEVTLASYNRSALRFDKNDVTREYRLTIGAEVVLRDARTRKVIYTARRVEGEKAFFVTVTLPVSERLATPYALDDLAQHIVERITERW
ncbi:MAG: LptE family protein [Candidatus Aureabacteria bacterium]|nr:LptE family protein [Candidatus Auribacterota bacterium]